MRHKEISFLSSGHRSKGKLVGGLFSPRLRLYISGYTEGGLRVVGTGWPGSSQGPGACMVSSEVAERGLGMEGLPKHQDSGPFGSDAERSNSEINFPRES